MKVFLALIVLLASKGQAAVICGTVEAATGKVEILRIKAEEQGKENPTRLAQLVSKPTPIQCDDVIVTSRASRAKVKFENSVLTLSPNSRISVAKFSGPKNSPSEVDLTFGRARVFFAGQKKATDKAPFRVKTPSATAGIRGTDFYISYEPNTALTEQATLTGMVEVEKNGSKQKVVVPPGKQVTVLDPKKEDQPLSVLEIKEETKAQIRQTSSLAKNEKVFTSKEAIKILGSPETWLPPADEVPLELKEIKNEF